MNSRATLTYCGHSAVIVQTERNLRIAIDPFLEGNPSCPLQLLEPGRIDAIALTHGHSDHVGSTLELGKRHQARLFANFELGELLVKDGYDESLVESMNKGGTVPYADGSIFVSLTHAFHSSSYVARDGKTHYAGEPCGVVIKLESGRTIYHAGDTIFFSDMWMIRNLYQPDVVLLPIGDRYTMGPREAAQAVEVLAPQVVIPIHYGTWPALTGTPEQLIAALEGSDVNTRVVALKPGETLALEEIS